MNKVEFGKYLSLMRKRLKLTQQELAEIVNCTWETISRIENGHELPGKKLFMELNGVFEAFGIIYDELDLDKIFNFRGARKELLLAIKRGRIEEIERKLERFFKLMQEDGEEESPEDKQYFVLAYLIMARKTGMTIEHFLEEIVKVFEIRRNMPNYEDIPYMKLTQIEYEILFLIGEVHVLRGDQEGEYILRGLMANRIDKDSPFIKTRYVEISAVLAKAFMMRKDYGTMQECLTYVFNDYISNNDTRTFFNSLTLHGEMCKIIGDKEGARLVDEFLLASQRLMGHMYRSYRISRNI